MTEPGVTTAGKPPVSRAGVVALVLACVSLGLSLVSCGMLAMMDGNDFSPLESKPELATASQVESIAHVTLPTGTVFLAGVRTDGLEVHLSARFRIPRAALDTFIESGRFTATVTPGLRAVTTKHHNVGGGDSWNPDAAAAVSGLQEDEPGPDNTYRSLLLDLGDPDTVTVYLYASQP